jgi:mRNA-degrading endonuclease RelE of RelBE toxin-antitoxin system
MEARDSTWDVTYSTSAARQYRKLPEKIQAIVIRLKKEIETSAL